MFISHTWCIPPFLYHTYSFLLFVNPPAQKDYKEDDKDNNKDNHDDDDNDEGVKVRGAVVMSFRFSTGVMAMASVL